MKPDRKFANYISEHRNLLCFIINFACFLTVLIVFFISGTPEAYENAVKLAIAVFAADMIASIGILWAGRSARDVKSRKKGGGDVKPLLKNIVPLDVMRELSFPILITDSKGYIAWHNGAAEDCFAHESGGVLRKSVAAVTGNQLSAEKFHEIPGASEPAGQPDSRRLFSPLKKPLPWEGPAAIP